MIKAFDLKKLPTEKTIKQLEKVIKMRPVMRKFQEMRLKSYQRLSLKQPLEEWQLIEYKALAKELYGLEV